jgi:hypothetical protein
MSYITFLRVVRNGHPKAYVQIEGQVLCSLFDLASEARCRSASQQSFGEAKK